MSFYRNILIGFAVAAFTMPVFAHDTAATSTPDQSHSQQAADTIELTENGVKTPVPDEAKTTTTTTTTTSNDTATPAATDGKVDLNKATVKDLMKVKGINASKAKAIVSYRKKHGDFKSLDELSQVKGFKKLKAEDLKQITDQLAM